MQQMLALMIAEQKKLSPKQQAFANNAMNDEEYTGDPKEGAIDKLGGLLGGLMDWGRNRRERNRPGGRNRQNRNQRTNNPNRPSRARGLWDNLTRRASGARAAAGNAWASTPRRGKVAVISGLLMGAGAGAWSLFGGDEDETPSAADVADIQRQVRNYGLPAGTDAHQPEIGRAHV